MAGVGGARVARSKCTAHQRFGRYEFFRAGEDQKRALRREAQHFVVHPHIKMLGFKSNGIVSKIGIGLEGQR